MYETACPGWHNDRWRLAEASSEPHDEHPVHGNPVWCEGCQARVRAALGYMPRHAGHLLLEIEYGTPVVAERVSGSRERALHPKQGPALLIDEIRDLLTQWEDDLRDQRGLSGRPTALRHGTAIDAASRFLLAHLGWALASAADVADPAGPVREYVDRLYRLDRRALRLTHRDDPPPQPIVDVWCPECELRALERELDFDGSASGSVRCRNCGSRMDEDEYTGWAGRLVGFYRGKRVAA